MLMLPALERAFHLRHARSQIVHQRFMSQAEDQGAGPPILGWRKRRRRGEKAGGGSSSQGQASGSGSGAPQAAADFADEMRITFSATDMGGPGFRLA